MKVRSRLLTWVAAVLAVFALVLGVSTPAFADVGDEPEHGKHLQDNGDGTYTISLSVTGDSEKQPNKVNVIVIVDRSGSMSTQSGTGAYVPTNGTGTGLYGLIEGQYVPLERRGTPGNRTFWYNGVQYTGQRYQYDNTATRMQATQAAVNSLAETLLDYNGRDGNPTDTVQIALVSFATTAQTNVNPTTSFSTFSNAVNSLNANGGTNWEAGLQYANAIDFGDSDLTYVIFFSDGSPTFRVTQAGYYDQYQAGVYGTGQEQEPNMTRAYDNAVDDAAALATKFGEERFYTIFAYGTTTGSNYMRSLTTGAGAPASNNYSASNTAELNDAFAEILENIEMAGIGNVGIDDGTTSNVGTSTDPIELLEVVPNFHYYRAGGEYSDLADYDPENGQYGQEWTDAPEAQFTDPTVTWNIPGVLDNGVIYTVTFDCYPSQTTLDYIADIENGLYSTLPAEVREYINEDGELQTNTTATLTWNDTRNDPATSGEATYTNPDPVESNAVERLAVAKEWTNDVDSQISAPIDLIVTRDGEPHDPELTLSSENDWKGSVYISIGIMRTDENGQMEVLTTGHDFSFVEPKDIGYRWELDVPTVHPMLIDGELTMLIKVDEAHQAPSGAKTYEIGDATYYVGDDETAGLTATNYRRSQLVLTKTVTGEDVPDDAVFPFTLTVTNSKASEGTEGDINSDYYVWFTTIDAEGENTDDVTVTGADKEAGTVGWYHVASGTSFSVDLPAGYSVRFINLPKDSTYTFVEGEMDPGFRFVEAELTAGEDDDFEGDVTSTGTIVDWNTEYEVTYTNEYAIVSVTVDKVWDDASDQDGVRPETLTLTLNGLPTGTTAPTPEITKSDDGNKWTYTWSELPKYDADGEEIEYTVTEGTVPEGYEVSGSPAKDKGTITNTHTPETTTVTVVKEWDSPADVTDPTSVTVQLMAGEDEVGDPVTLDGQGQWTYTWENLPVNADGEAIEYTVVEDPVPTGYKAEVEMEGDAENGFTFTVTNTYDVKPVEATIPATKVMDVPAGATGPASWSYTMTLTAKDGAPAPETTTGTATQDSDTVKFGPITYNAPGTYTYEVSESGNVDGVTNDTETTKTVTVTVESDGEGGLTATVSPVGGAIFTNKYTLEPTTATIEATKVLEGAPLAAGAFEFTLTAKDGAPEPANTTATNLADGTVSFGEITYTAPGTYVYDITEVNGGKKGYTYDTNTVTATVTVADKGDGTMSASVAYSPEGATFTNTYKASGDITITAVKILEGRALDEGQFTFELVNEKGEVVATATNDASGQIAFDLTFDQTVFGDDEAASDDTGGDESAEPGRRAATVVEEAPADALVEDEAAEPEAVVETEDADEAAEPEATEAEVTEPEDETDEAEPASEDGGDFSIADAFGDLAEFLGIRNIFAPTLAFAEEGDTRSVELTYTIREVAGSEDYYTYATNEVTVTVTVTDNGDGTLIATATYKPEEAEFINTYKATGSVTLSGTKVVEGAELEEGQFSFTLSGDGIEDQTVTNAADGSFSFNAISYTEKDAGKSFTYTITEETGSEKGWTYDSHTCNVTVTVTDNGNGTLTCTPTYDGGNEFTNTFKLEPVIIDPPVEKIITGDTPDTDETFTFQMKAVSPSDAPMPAGASGGVMTMEIVGADTKEFGEATITEPGTYVYEITEVAGSAAGYTYDTTVYTVTFVVEEDTENAKLVISETIIVDGDGNEAESVTFTNTYKKEEPPKPPVPKTGDTTPAVSLIAGIAALGAGFVAAGAVRRRREH